MKRLLSLILVIILSFSTVSINVSASTTPSDWALDEVNNAISIGLVTDSVQADYQADITREQFCEMVIRAYEKISNNTAEMGNITFSDTDNAEILKAANLGIVSGYGGGIFAPDDLITREQIATMLVRMIDSAVTYENVSIYNNNYFADASSISDWAVSSVNFAYDKRLMQGVGDNRIDPQANTTCEQAILLVYRTINKYYDEESRLDSVYELTEEHIAQDDETFVHYTDNIILAFIESGLSEERKEEIAHIINGDIVAQLAGSINLLQIEVKKSTLDELQIMAEKLMKSDEVNYASPDIITNKKSIANTSNNQTDITYEGENEWWFNVIEAQDTWNEYGKFINKTTVGVIDSVINTEHEDLKNKVSFANDYYNNYNQINLALETNSALQTFDSTYVNHGTMISGIIAANRNDIGMTGISNKSDIVFAAFSPNEKEWNSFSGDLYAFKQILNNQDIKVVNFSLQNVYYDKTYFDNHKYDDDFKDYKTYSDFRAAETKYLDEEAKEYAAVMCELIRNNREILVVQAAGNGVNNEGPGVDARFAGIWTRINNVTCDEVFEKYDIDYDEIKNRIMIVGAIENKSNNNIDYTMTSFSNHGKNIIDICAPGRNIRSCNSIGKDLVDNTWVDDYYSNGSGTSEAAPMVTGTAAVLWGIDPTLAAEEVKEFIINGTKCKAIGVGVDEGTEYPMLNVRGAVEELLKTKAVHISVGDKDTNGRIQDATVSYGNSFSETTDIIGNCDIYLLDDAEWADVKEILLEKETIPQSEVGTFSTVVEYNGKVYSGLEGGSAIHVGDPGESTAFCIYDNHIYYYHIHTETSLEQTDHSDFLQIWRTDLDGNDKTCVGFFERPYQNAITRISNPCVVDGKFFMSINQYNPNSDESTGWTLWGVDLNNTDPYDNYGTVYLNAKGINLIDINKGKYKYTIGCGPSAVYLAQKEYPHIGFAAYSADSGELRIIDEDVVVRDAFGYDDMILYTSYSDGTYRYNYSTGIKEHISDFCFEYIWGNEGYYINDGSIYAINLETMNSSLIIRRSGHHYYNKIYTVTDDYIYAADSGQTDDLLIKQIDRQSSDSILIGCAPALKQ